MKTLRHLFLLVTLALVGACNSPPELDFACNLPPAAGDCKYKDITEVELDPTCKKDVAPDAYAVLCDEKIDDPQCKPMAGVIICDGVHVQYYCCK